MARTEIPSYTINQLITAAHANTYLKDNEAAHWALISDMDYECNLIEEKLLTTTGYFLFTSIPQTYTNLELIMSVRAVATTSQNLRLYFNGDGASNYDYQSMISSSTTVTAGEVFKSQGALIGVIPGNGATAGYFSGVRIFIPNYRRGYQKGAIVTHVSFEDTASLYTYAVHWRKTEAINKITLNVQNANVNFVAGCVASLYGRL